MTDVSLREHLESQIQWVDRHFSSHILTIQEKTKEARDQIDKRLEGMNEFRDTLKDQASRLATKTDVLSLERQMDSRIKSLEINKANLEGKAAIVSVVVASVVSMLVVALSRFL